MITLEDPEKYIITLDLTSKKAVLNGLELRLEQLVKQTETIAKNITQTVMEIEVLEELLSDAPPPPEVPQDNCFDPVTTPTPEGRARAGDNGNDSSEEEPLDQAEDDTPVAMFI